MNELAFYFPGLGTAANMLLILVGAIIGLLVGKRFPQRLREAVVHASGLVVLFIGISGVITALIRVDGGGLSSRFTLTIIISLILGAIIGELLDIEGGLDRAGAWLEKRVVAVSGKQTQLAEAFCFTTILYCTGAMAIVGALNDGLLGDPNMLISKGIIDGMVSIVFAATMGPGVLFSALSVGLYQGLITALAVAAEPLLTEAVIAQMSGVGSLIIVAISLKMLEIKKFRIGNLLPGMFLPLLWYAITQLF